MNCCVWWWCCDCFDALGTDDVVFCGVWMKGSTAATFPFGIIRCAAYKLCDGLCLRWGTVEGCNNSMGKYQTDCCSMAAQHVIVWSVIEALIENWHKSEPHTYLFGVLEFELVLWLLILLLQLLFPIPIPIDELKRWFCCGCCWFWYNVILDALFFWSLNCSSYIRWSTERSSAWRWCKASRCKCKRSSWCRDSWLRYCEQMERTKDGQEIYSMRKWLIVLKSGSIHSIVTYWTMHIRCWMQIEQMNVLLDKTIFCAVQAYHLRIVLDQTEISGFGEVNGLFAKLWWRISVE